MCTKTEKYLLPIFPPTTCPPPADAALMRHLGAQGVFVGSGIFKSDNPAKRVKAIVATAVKNYDNPQVLAEVSKNLGEAMVGINEDEIKTIMANRGI